MPTTHSVSICKHATLTMNQIDTINFSTPLAKLRISNRSSTDIFFTTNGEDLSTPQGDAVDPTVAGDDVFCVPGNDHIERVYVTFCRQVKVIADHAAKYSVELLSA